MDRSQIVFTLLVEEGTWAHITAFVLMAQVCFFNNNKKTNTPELDE